MCFSGVETHRDYNLAGLTLLVSINSLAGTIEG
nr:MAG TPA: hypothetical protein [Caudoviricetes sp.]